MYMIQKEQGRDDNQTYNGNGMTTECKNTMYKDMLDPINKKGRGITNEINAITVRDSLCRISTGPRFAILFEIFLQW